MEQLSYTYSNLLECITYSDLMENKSLIDYSARVLASKSAQRKAAEKSFLEDGVKEINISGKKGIKFKTIEDKLISRLLVRNLKKSYKISRVNRHDIIKNLIINLKDGSPYNIARLDIKSFYDSIDFKVLLDKIVSDGKVSRYDINLLYKFKDSLDQKMISGLPRGISLSATLAELCLQEIDSFFLKEKDFFYYSRFVDDILIIHHGGEITKQFITDYFSSHLPGNLTLHEKEKLAFLNIAGARGNINDDKTQVDKVDEMDFLGYNFKIYNIYNENDHVFLSPNRKIHVDLSVKKIHKIKVRIIKSFVAFINSNKSHDDFLLLNDRIKFITGNYPIKDPVSGIKINSGIFYNYQYKNVGLNCSLVELDNFLRSILFGSNNTFSKRISNSLTIQQKRIIAKLNFKSGFYMIRFHTFSYSRLKEIKGCWK
ncbi:RNA-directed DNA polymerase [Klebsiella pneumoniae]|uniref:antiviral reverse transcriptase Drt3a n=1 Tax=Klebsiella pneumoniae TaxID=573 RepID=UPI001899D6B2|nr:antiviral reverse transcriptase Drt3a [Klebsiella pneumoniae]MBK2430815.1 RNA-directed DNA polymerase [Klebsiella pneumoniae]